MLVVVVLMLVVMLVAVVVLQLLLSREQISCRQQMCLRRMKQSLYSLLLIGTPHLRPL
jgi:hypothetical protein